jgi:DNA-binding HxlR family transcriptional regulator
MIAGFNKAFESRIRLGIMSVLSVNEVLDFNALKNLLETTDGNLASHLKALEKEAYVGIEKSFVGRKPNTKYFITPEGKKAFTAHLDALEALIHGQKNT